MKKTLLIFCVSLFLCVFALGQNDANKPYSIEDKIDAEIAEVSKAISADPNNAQLYMKRANLYRVRWNAAATSSDVSKALAISPNDLSLQFTAIRMLYEMPENCTQALAIINSTIANHPKNDQAYEWRFRVKTCLGDLTGALDDINTALALNPQNTIYRNNQALLLQKLSQTDKALENFNQLIASLEPKLKDEKDRRARNDLMMAYFSRSRLFAKNENFDAMFADLNRAVEVNPIPYAYQTRARAYKWRQMYAEAIADLSKALELDDDDSSLLFDRAEIYFLLKKFPEAVRDYELILKLNNGLEQLAETRLAEAKQKMKEN